MAKMTRERAVKERRERKRQKKADKKLAALEPDVTPAAEPDDDEVAAAD
jgi:hypothetical protein